MGNSDGRLGIVEGVTIAALLSGLSAGTFWRFVLQGDVRELQGIASVGAVLGVLAYGAALAVLRWGAAKSGGAHDAWNESRDPRLPLIISRRP